MSDVKKDHSIGAGTGAMTGAVAGAAVGSAAGPAGSAVGAVVGGIAGAKAGDSIAELVNPTDYNDYFQREFRKAPYFVGGSEWRDYEPAYKYGYETFPRYRGHRFEEVEPELERNWDAIRANSRLSWPEARQALRDGWHYIERALPGDADRDTR